MSESKKGKYSVIIVTLLILIGIVGGVWMERSKYEPIRIGYPAPDFTLKDLNGKEYTLSELKGKVVFVNFWATWCKTCKDEMPSMEVLYSYLKQRKVPFEMLAISVDRITTQDDVETFVKTLGLTFPVLLDPWGKTDGKYKLTGVPETYIIDQDGNVAEKVIGPRDWTTVQAVKTIFNLLGIKPEPQSGQG